MNQGTGRIVIIVALVVVGVAVLANGFDGGGGAVGATPSASETPSPTETTTPTETATPTATPEPQTTAVLFMALNGTSVTGLAAEVQDALVADGYIAAKEAANAPTSGVQVTTVYFRGGDGAAQNESDATYVAETYFPDIDARVKELSDQFNEIVPNTATLAIVVGQDFADALAAGG